MKNLSAVLLISLIQFTSYSAIAGTIPTNGLTNYFSFDGTPDDLVGGVVGTLHGNASFVSGVIGDAISFDGNSDYVDLSGLLVGASSSWSMCGFAQINDNNRRHTFYGEYSNISSGETDNYIVHLGQDNANLGVSYDTFPPNGGATTSRILNVGAWSAFCVIRDQATVSIYLDGQLEGQAPYEHYTGNAATLATFGARMKSAGLVYDSPADTTQYSMNGMLDEVRVYDRALNENEILSLSLPGGLDDAIGISFYRGQASPAQIYMSDLDGSNLRKVSVGSSSETIHAWSPNGSKLLFTRVDEIYIADADEHGNLDNITNLTENPANDHSAAWTPDGNGIVFSSNRHGNFELYSMDLDGGGVERLTFTSRGERNPAIAPDGSIAATQDDNRLVVFTESGGVYTEHLVYSAGTVVTPNWTPDSQKIIFSAGSSSPGAVNNDLAIYSIDRSGLNLDQIISGFANSPSLSPDGENIVYMANRNGAPAPLEIFNLSSGIIRSLGQTGNLPQWRPALPPNSPPTITGQNTIEVDQFESFSAIFEITDPDGDTTNVTAEGLPVGAFFTAISTTQYELSWGPEIVEAGLFAVLIDAVDSNGGGAQVEVTIKVVENSPPIINGLSYFEIDENVLYSASWDIWDSNLDEINDITVLGLPVGASYEVTVLPNGQSILDLFWTPTLTQGGKVYFVSLIATDEHGYLTELEIEIDVSNSLAEYPSSIFLALDEIETDGSKSQFNLVKWLYNHVFLGENKLLRDLIKTRDFISQEINDFVVKKMIYENDSRLIRDLLVLLDFVDGVFASEFYNQIDYPVYNTYDVVFPFPDPESLDEIYVLEDLDEELYLKYIRLKEDAGNAKSTYKVFSTVYGKNFDPSDWIGIYDEFIELLDIRAAPYITLATVSAYQQSRSWYSQTHVPAIPVCFQEKQNGELNEIICPANLYEF